MHLPTLRFRKYNPDGVGAHRAIGVGYRMYNTMGDGHTVRLAWTMECTMDNGTPRGLMEFGRGGACVPARVALQGRIHRSYPAYNVCVFGMETPLRERSGGHTGTAPTVSFG